MQKKFTDKGTCSLDLKPAIYQYILYFSIDSCFCFQQINQNREEFFRLMTAPVAGAGSESSAEHAGAPVQGSGTGGAGLDPLAAALAGGVASEGRGVTGGGANTPGYITINLTHEERAHIETVHTLLTSIVRSLYKVQHFTVSRN